MNPHTSNGELSLSVPLGTPVLKLTHTLRERGEFSDLPPPDVAKLQREHPELPHPHPPLVTTPPHVSSPMQGQTLLDRWPRGHPMEMPHPTPSKSFPCDEQAVVDIHLVHQAAVEDQMDPGAGDPLQLSLPMGQPT